MEFDEAKGALTQAISADNAGISDGSQIPNSRTGFDLVAEGVGLPGDEGASTVTPTPEQGEQGATVEDSFTGLDPNSLPEEVRPFYRSMQRDYTQKMQQAAPLRKLVEMGIDPQQAYEAVQLYQGLASDPTYARGLYEELGSYLRAQGLVDTSNPAAPATPAPAADPFSGFGADEQFGGLDDPVLQHMQRIEQQMQTLSSKWDEERQQAYQAQQEAMWQSQLAREEQMIRQANPSYSDADFDAIYQLSAAYGGSLLPAQAAYQAHIDRAITGYLASKGAQAAGTPGIVPSGTAAQTPQRFGTLDEAHRAAVQELRNVLGSDG